MTRSPLAYPLNRGADADLGGAADLQTDVMRFMAILALCLVAIFALVQSMPVAPLPAPAPVTVAALPPAAAPLAKADVKPAAKPLPQPAPVAEPIKLTRPSAVSAPQAAGKTLPDTAAPQPVEPQAEGFTLRFESDAALTRLVAAHKVGVYAIDGERARRMTVSESRISFWDASLPNRFHEMDAATVPGAVVDALVRTGVDSAGIRWGVTLPGHLKGQLDELLREHRGGALIIEPSGTLRLEKT